MTTTQKHFTPFFVKILAGILFVFGISTFFGSLFLWGEGFLFFFPEKIDYSFPITDLLINAPASILAAVGLWKMRRYGYIAAQFVAGFYIYTSVQILLSVFQEHFSHGTEIILPQMLVAFVAFLLVVYLWRVQGEFTNKVS